MSPSVANDRRKQHSSDVSRVLLRTIVALLLTVLIWTGCKQRRSATTTPQMNAELGFWVRVLLLDDVNNCTLRILSQSKLISVSSSAAEPLYLEEFEKQTTLSINDGQINIAGLSFADRELSIYPEGPHIFELNGNDYRGILKFIINPAENTFDVINWIPLEPYLAGVIGAEMPDYWEPEALKAQAVAARTYCLYIKKRFGQFRAWDVSKTQAHQVYRGVSAESAQIWNAVNQTSGKALHRAQADDGTEDIFPAYYSSSCGGHTEASSKVFGRSLGAFPGVPCSYCQDVTRPGLFNWSGIEYDKKEVSRRLRERYSKLVELGEIEDIVVVDKSDYEDFSRITKVKLVGSNGKSEFLRAEDLRLSIDPTGRKLKSAAFEIQDMGDRWAFLSGRGFGHGVGMCQCGAEGMARAGKLAEEILAHYYPDSRIVDIYKTKDE